MPFCMLARISAGVRTPKHGCKRCRLSNLDVLEHGRLDFVAGAELSPVDALGFEGTEEVLHGRVTRRSPKPASARTRPPSPDSTRDTPASRPHSRWRLAASACAGRAMLVWLRSGYRTSRRPPRSTWLASFAESQASRSHPRVAAILAASSPRHSRLTSPATPNWAECHLVEADHEGRARGDPYIGSM